MKNYRFPITRVMALTLSIAIYSTAFAGNSESLVKGFADYQAGRVENIILDDFMYDLAKQKYLKKFFPLTSKNIETFDGISGKRLIPVISYYFEQDLVPLRNMSFCLKQKLHPLKSLLNPSDVESLRTVIVAAISEDINELKDLKGNIKSKDVSKITKNLKNLLENIKDLTDKIKKIKPNQVIAAVKNEINKLEDIKEAFKVLDLLMKLKKEEEFSVADFNKTADCPKNKPSNGSASRSETFFTDLTGNASTFDPAPTDDYIIAVANAAVSSPLGAENLAAKKEIGAVADSKYNFFSTKIFDAVIEKIKKSEGILSNDDFILIIEDQLKSKATLGIAPNDAIGKDVDLPGLIESLENNNILKNCGEDKNYAICIHQLTMALEALGFQVDDRKGFQKFRSASLFLASLKDATSTDSKNGNQNGASAVAAVIRDYVDEDEVYKNKRNSIAMYTGREGKSYLRCNWLINCHDTWFIGSYYGLSLAKLRENTESDQHYQYRAFGPVGVEFKIYSGRIKLLPSFKKWNWPGMYTKPNTVTIMYAPIDLGVYVTNELRSEKYDVSIDDIRAPSWFISITPTSGSPRSFQFGFQKKVLIENKKTENMWFMALSFDLPLFTLW